MPLLWGVVGRGGDVLDLQLLAGRSPYGRGELASPFRGDDGGYTESGYPVADEGLHAGVTFLELYFVIRSGNIVH